MTVLLGALVAARPVEERARDTSSTTVVRHEASNECHQRYIFVRTPRGHGVTVYKTRRKGFRGLLFDPAKTVPRRHTHTVLYDAAQLYFIDFFSPFYPSAPPTHYNAYARFLHSYFLRVFAFTNPPLCTPIYSILIN